MNRNRPETAAALHRFYVAARSHFGYTDRWWPGTPVELTITAILVQQCDWTVAWKAAKRMRAPGLLNLVQMAEAEAAAVTELIQAVAYPRQKASRLIDIANRLVTGGFATIEEVLQGGSTEQVRQQLLVLPGIGEETADSILLFAADRHETFVVDAYTRRLFQRLDLFDGCDQGFWRLPYDRVRRFFLENITDSLSLYDGLAWSPTFHEVWPCFGIFMPRLWNWAGITAARRVRVAFRLASPAGRTRTATSCFVMIIVPIIVARAVRCRTPAPQTSDSRLRS